MQLVSADHLPLQLDGSTRIVKKLQQGALLSTCFSPFSLPSSSHDSFLRLSHFPSFSTAGSFVARPKVSLFCCFLAFKFPRAWRASEKAAWVRRHLLNTNKWVSIRRNENEGEGMNAPGLEHWLSWCLFPDKGFYLLGARGISGSVDFGNWKVQVF